MEIELYTVEEFLKAFGISRTAFYGEVRAGRLRMVKFGVSSRVTRADAMAWVNALPSHTAVAA